MKSLSKFVHKVEAENKDHFALFHAGRISTIFLSKDCEKLVSELESGLDESTLNPEANEILLQLQNEGFLSSEDQDFATLSRLQKTLHPRLCLMYLIITDHCNLGCKYCFIEAGFPSDYQCNEMSWDTAKSALDYFIEHREQDAECSVWLYGGEPFMNQELLFSCLDYMSRNDPEVKVVIVNNGTMITEEIASKLALFSNLQISVSLDGPKEINDQKRIDKSGNGSYDRIMKGINNLRNNNIQFGISCTIAEHNVDSIDSILEWICDETGSKDIGVNFLVDTPRAFVDEEYIKKANDGMIRFVDKARFTDIYEGRMIRKIETFAEQVPRWHDCGACGEQMVISPTGEVGVCHEGLGERRTFVGELVPDFDYFGNATIKEWSNRSPLNMPECEECIAFGVCGGGCPYGAMLRYGSIWNVDKRFCIHSKDTLQWLIWDLYDRMELQDETDVS